MADRIVVMRDGKTEQIDRPDIVYREPRTPFVAGFIGTMNLIEGQVANGVFSKAGYATPLPVGDGPATLAVRPEALDLSVANENGQGKVHRVTDYGTHGLVDLELLDATRVKAMVSHPDLFKAGQGVNLAPKAIAAYRDGTVIYRSSASEVTTPQRALIDA